MKDTATPLLPDAPVWREPQWLYDTGWHQSGALWLWMRKHAHLIRQAEADGIRQVAPICVAYRRPPAEVRAIIGGGLWKRVHHSDVIDNAWRAKIKLTTKLPFATIMDIPRGAFREVNGMVSHHGEAAVTIAARMAGNRTQMREAVVLVRDTIRMGGEANPAWSLRRLREEHDRLAREHARRSADPKPFAVPWRCEIDGFAFTRLVSAADFAEEGAIMRHCIASYARDAKSGRETAFRIEGPERASVSFATSGHVEIRGRLNARVTEPCRRAAMKAWATFKAEPSTPR